MSSQLFVGDKMVGGLGADSMASAAAEKDIQLLIRDSN